MSEELLAFQDRDNLDIVIAHSPEDASAVWAEEHGEINEPPPVDVWGEVPVTCVVRIYKTHDPKDGVDSKTIKEWIEARGRCVLCVDTGEV